MNKRIMMPMVITSAFILSFSGTTLAGDPAAGEKQAGQCASCHGANGEGSGDNPKIAGMKKGDFVKAMNEYKTGKRKHMMMEMFAKKLSDKDFADLAAFYGAK